MSISENWIPVSDKDMRHRKKLERIPSGCAPACLRPQYQASATAHIGVAIFLGRGRLGLGCAAGGCFNRGCDQACEDSRRNADPLGPHVGETTNISRASMRSFGIGVLTAAF